MRSLAGWLDDRTGIGRLCAAFRDKPIGRKPAWSRTFGPIVLVLLGFVCLSGVVLSLSYSPSADHAHGSVQYIINEVDLGGFIRSLHFHGTNFLVIALVIYGFQLIRRAAYRTPFELQWWIGLGAFALIIAIATVGYLLPWDQHGYWGTRVRTSIISSIPLIGNLKKEFLLGGPEIGNLSLTRFYTAHVVVLPFLLVGFLGAYMMLSSRNAYLTEKGEDSIPWWPSQASRDLLAGTGVVVLLFLVARWLPHPLGDKADPLETYPARPEWYFLWLFQSLKYFKGPTEVIGTVAVPGACALFLFLLPYIDRKGEKSLSCRKPVLAFLFISSFSWIALTGIALSEDYRSGHFKEMKIWSAQPDPDFDVDAFYERDCFECHGKDGSGYLDSTPDFSSVEYWSTVRSDYRLIKTILDGVANEMIPEDEQMPAYRDEITADQAKAVVVRKIRPFAPSED